MSALAISSVIFAVIFAGSLLGLVLSRRLPKHHIDDASKDIVRLVMGLIATMAALVLGLLIASAKSAYDRQSTELVELAAEIIQLDRILSLYGPDAQPARAGFHSAVARSIDRIWPDEKARSGNIALPEASQVPTEFFVLISNLNPTTNIQRVAQSRALDIAAGLSKTRVLMYEESGSSLSVPFLIVLVLWLVMVFVGFGLFAPANATVIATLFVGALSVAGALFLIMELDRPYEGLMHLSSTPLRSALAQIDAMGSSVPASATR